MQIQKRHLTKHRRQRYILWALAMLQWIAALLGGKNVSLRQVHQRGGVSLHGLTRMVMKLAIIRAGELARVRRRKLKFCKRGRDLRRSHLLRSLIGARLRRQLRQNDVTKRVAILIAVLRDLDSIARPIAQRMRRGLSRLWPIAVAPMAGDAIFNAPAPTPAFADSS